MLIENCLILQNSRKTLSPLNIDIIINRVSREYSARNSCRIDAKSDKIIFAANARQSFGFLSIRVPVSQTVAWCDGFSHISSVLDGHIS